MCGEGDKSEMDRPLRIAWESVTNIWAAEDSGDSDERENALDAIIWAGKEAEKLQAEVARLRAALEAAPRPIGAWLGTPWQYWRWYWKVRRPALKAEEG